MASQVLLVSTVHTPDLEGVEGRCIHTYTLYSSISKFCTYVQCTLFAASSVAIGHRISFLC
jgi:hypothetical protein